MFVRTHGLGVPELLLHSCLAGALFFFLLSSRVGAPVSVF